LVLLEEGLECVEEGHGRVARALVTGSLIRPLQPRLRDRQPEPSRSSG
jgi:hypothetical protein